jgi:hypothetical protein
VISHEALSEAMERVREAKLDDRYWRVLDLIIDYSHARNIVQREWVASDMDDLILQGRFSRIFAAVQTHYTCEIMREFGK